MMSGVVNAPSPFAGSASVAFSGSVPEKTQVETKNYKCSVLRRRFQICYAILVRKLKEVAMMQNAPMKSLTDVICRGGVKL